MLKRVMLLSFALNATGFLLSAQSTILTTGAEANGSGGSVSYSIGQVFYTISTGIAGSVIQGVQQPYEISVATAIKNTEEILLECNVFPNPTRGKVTLRIETDIFRNLRFRIIDMNGTLIREMKIENSKTEIVMDDLKSSTYFLIILQNNRELKTFKIIKH